MSFMGTEGTSWQIVSDASALQNMALYQQMGRLDIRIWEEADDAVIEIYESLRHARSFTALSLLFPRNLSNLGYYVILDAARNMLLLNTLRLTLDLGPGKAGVKNMDNRDRALKHIGDALMQMPQLTSLELNLQNVEGKVTEDGFGYLLKAVRSLTNLRKLSLGISVSSFWLASGITNKIAKEVGVTLSSLPVLSELTLELGINNELSMLCFYFITASLARLPNLSSLKINYVDVMEHGTTVDDMVNLAGCLKNMIMLSEFTLSVKSPHSKINDEALTAVVDALAVLPMRRVEIAMYRNGVSMVSENVKEYAKNALRNTTLILM